jgi:hypothetical protein
MYGHKVTVPYATTAIGLGVVLNSASSANVKMALYTDSSGSPGSLVASTPDTVAVVGRQDFTFADTSIAAGSYWVVTKLNGTFAVAANTGVGETVVYQSHSYATAFPASFGSATSYGWYAEDVYLITE